MQTTDITNCPGCSRACSIHELHCSKGESLLREIGQASEQNGSEIQAGHSIGYSAHHSRPHHHHGDQLDFHKHGDHMHCERSGYGESACNHRGKDSAHKSKERSNRHDWTKEAFDQFTIEEKILHRMRTLVNACRHGGSKEGQHRVLEVLQNGPASQQDLAALLSVRNGSMSEMISKMEAAGLVNRTSSQEDRRMMNITLTSSGLEEVAMTAQGHKQARNAMFAPLAETEKLELLALLERIYITPEEPAASNAPLEEIGLSATTKRHHGHHRR